MFCERNVDELMSVESSLLSFINRVNDAYIASHSIHDLISDSDYQKLTIKHGQAHGQPLGNRHILPGYWFSVFVAPYESFKRVLEALRIEDEKLKQTKERFFEDGDKETIKDEISLATEKFKHIAGHNPLHLLIEKFQTDIECLVSNIEKLDRNVDTFQNKKPLKSITNAISTGSYDFTEEDNLTCTFYENDLFCGKRFETKVKVADLNQFAIDFMKQLAEHLWPIVESNKRIKKEVAQMFIGEVFLKEL